MGPVIEILGEVEREAFSGKDGRRWVKRTQRCAIHRGEQYPTMADWPLAFRSEQEDLEGPAPEPYEPGHYELAPEALRVDARGNISFDDRVRLVEVGSEALRSVA